MTKDEELRNETAQSLQLTARRVDQDVRFE